jgi:tetratricopeptide (TPR) repeat protein/tRNA A-37 threonylcarbamoyl transferase component Bud32
MLICPGDDRLLRYMQGRGDESDPDGVAEHLEGCPACRRRVADLALMPSTDPISGTRRLGNGAGAGNSTSGTSALHTPSAIETGRPTDERTPGSVADGPSTDPLDTVSASFSPSTAGSSGTGSEGGRDALPQVKGYKVLERLGAGGMGVVYKARQVGLNRLVALKMIREDRQMQQAYLARFLQEAEAVARLRHPNIIQIFDIGEAEGAPFVALELLEGGNLSDWLAGNPQPGRTAAELMVTLARAVQVAHEAAIIHRDLKPSNVLLTTTGVPKISDFGLAKRIDDDSSQSDPGQILGTPSYMAPEQASNSKQVGLAADVYALGAIFYEMLAGRPPFKGETRFETVRQVIHDDPVPPSRLVPRVARDLETICLKCLAKDPQKRYRTAAALGDDLQRYLDGKPIQARPTPLWERGVKWARRRPAAAALLALAATVCLGVSAALVEYQRYLAQKTRLENDRIARLLAENNPRLLAAQQALVRNDLKELTRVQESLAGAQGQIKDESDPRLSNLKVLADLMLTTIRQRVADRRSEEEARARREQERARYQSFLDLRDEALLQDTPFTGLGLAENREGKRGAARAALACFTAPGPRDSWALALPESLSGAEKARVTEGCYELLLILADTEPTAEDGLRRLDQAASLHVPITRAYHLRRAACLARARNGLAAEQERRKAEALTPDGAVDHFLLGQESYKREPETGLRHFDEALNDRPEHFWAQCLSALCLLEPQIARPEEARARLTACLQRKPEYAWLYLLRGFASSQHAGFLLNQALKTPSRRDDFQERAHRQFENAERDYQRATRLLKPGTNDELRYALLINQGSLALLRDQPDQAVERLRDAIRLRPREVPAYTTLARVSLKQDRPDQAREQWTRAIDLVPNRAEFYRGRAEVELARPSPTSEQRARALRDLDRAIALERPQDHRDRARDHLDRARLLELDHHEAQALAACDAALAADRDDLEAHRLRIKLLADAGQHAEVIRSCEDLIARGTTSPWVLERRGLARAYCNDYPGAIDDFTRVLALSTMDRAPLLRQRGRLHLLSNAPQQALRDFEEAIRLEPSHGDGYHGRGSALATLGRLPEAVADAEDALKHGEPNWLRFYWSARIHAQAAVAAVAEARGDGRAALIRSGRYQDRAVVLLLEALRRSPPDRVESLWRDLQSDPVLRTIQRRVSAGMKWAGMTIIRAPSEHPPATPVIARGVPNRSAASNPP